MLDILLLTCWANKVVLKNAWLVDKIEWWHLTGIHVYMGIWAWCNYSCWPSLYHFLLTGKDLLLTLASHKLSIVLAPRLVWCRGQKDRPFSLFAKDASRRVIGTNHMVLVSIINIFCQLSNRILHRHANPGQCHTNDGIFSYKSLSAMTKYGIISVQYPFWILNFRECMWHHCI